MEHKKTKNIKEGKNNEWKRAIINGYLAIFGITLLRYDSYSGPNTLLIMHVYHVGSRMFKRAC